MTVRQLTRGDKTPLGGAWYGRLRCSHHPKEAPDVLPPPCHRAAGVAPVVAAQHGWDLSAPGPGAWGPLDDLGAATGHDVAGDGQRLQRPPPPAPLSAAGVRGSRRQKPRGAP